MFDQCGALSSGPVSAQLNFCILPHSSKKSGSGLALGIFVNSTFGQHDFLSTFPM
jgi:hypothetical protein